MIRHKSIIFLSQNVFISLTLLMFVWMSGCSKDSSISSIVVNSLSDQSIETTPVGVVTLRSALALAVSGQAITFDPSLDGETISLSLVGEEHSILKGEFMGMRDEPSGPISYLVGYFDRDYGRSALYAQKNVVIDASDLPSGITIAWSGGEANPARILAVYGDLTMINVSITGGRSIAEALPVDPTAIYEQLSTRARGGGVAVWGVATLINCTFYDNHCFKDNAVPSRSRDSGAFGGGVYADIVDIENSVISGNSVVASGVSGGGVFSVGGAASDQSVSSIRQSAITGNYISGYFAYGGGVYSDGGGIGNRKNLQLTNSTIAMNVVDFLDPVPFGYWRGGGVYMSNGYLDIKSCTVVENEVYGVARTDSLDRRNLAGGIAATVGNAHAVEEMNISHSIITGNSVHEFGGNTYAQDIFSGSLFYFRSGGYNRFGVIDFSQILVPVGEPDWASLSRKQYPQTGDVDGVAVGDVLNLTTGVITSPDIQSLGVNAGNPIVLYYQPAGSALNQVPAEDYLVNEIYAEYQLLSGGTDNFLEIFLGRVESTYSLNQFAATFVDDFELFLNTVDTDADLAGLQPYISPGGDAILTLADTLWFGPAQTWPSELSNYPYIEFWHRLDIALESENISGMGPELLNGFAWASLFSSGELNENPSLVMSIIPAELLVSPVANDQLETKRPTLTLADIGAIEKE
jgi:hypothetical protein